MIEPFTAHYVFALGVALFLGCAHWIISVYETGGTYLYLLGSGYFWLPMVLLSEIIQTFILADFCYYYVKRPMNKTAGMHSKDDDLDLTEFSQESKSGQSSSRQHASRPEAMPLDFVVRPQSKIDPDEIRARAKQVVQDQRRLKIFPSPSP